MATVIETNKEYDLLQGKNAVILNTGTVTIEAKYKDRSLWVALITASADPSFTIPFMKEGHFRITAQTGETTFDYSPQT